MVRKIIWRILLAAALLFCFVYFGGGRYLHKLGIGAEKISGEMVEYEMDIKDRISDVTDVVEETSDMYKDFQKEQRKRFQELREMQEKVFNE